MCRCWITNRLVSYITVNGYLGLVLLFNTAILVVTLVKMWHIKFRSVQHGNRIRRLWKDWVTVLGLSVVLGLPWGLAFSTYGPLSLPGIYLFTTLNAFQGKCTVVVIVLDLFPLLFPLVMDCLKRFSVFEALDEHYVFSSSRFFYVLVVLLNHIQVNSRGEEFNQEFLHE